jgi:hypothetical protein
MSMILNLTTISDPTRIKLLETPELIWRVVAPEDPEIFEEERQRELEDVPLLSRFFWNKTRFKRLQSAKLEINPEAGEGQNADLDKAWHAIHFMLTDGLKIQNFPEFFLLDGGTPVGQIDIGVDTARVFSLSEVAEIDTFLTGISSKAFMKKFDPELMTREKIYPEIWERSDGENEYVQENFETLKRIFRQAADQKVCVAVWLG